MKQNLTTLGDEALMVLVCDQHHPAFCELVSRHSTRFYAISFRTLGNKADAEDAVQEAFLKLWRKPEMWNPKAEARFTTWFYRVVLNVCYDQQRKRKTEPLKDDFDMADERENAEGELQRSEQKQVLENAIASLPERQQTALNLCFYEELSNQQAAEVMGLKLKALQSLLIRARANLKDRLSSQKGDIRHAG